MRTRAEQLGATLAVTSTPGGGTLVELVVPLQAVLKSGRPPGDTPSRPPGGKTTA